MEEDKQEQQQEEQEQEQEEEEEEEVDEGDTAIALHSISLTSIIEIEPNDDDYLYSCHCLLKLKAAQSLIEVAIDDPSHELQPFQKALLKRAYISGQILERAESHFIQRKLSLDTIFNCHIGRH